MIHMDEDVWYFLKKAYDVADNHIGDSLYAGKEGFWFKVRDDIMELRKLIVNEEDKAERRSGEERRGEDHEHQRDEGRVQGESVTTKPKQ